MKISSDTLAILKNYASINSNLTVRPGNILKTFAVAKNIYAQATVVETFPCEFGIWDLNKFLATVSLFKDPDFDFHEKYVKISSSTGNASINYFFSDISLLTHVPEGIKMPPATVEFDLNTKDFSELQKAAAVLQVPDLALATETDGIYFRVFDKKDKTSNTYQAKVCDNDAGLDFNAFFKTESLKVIPGHYKVGVSEKNISQFENTNFPIKYWITLEVDSVWHTSTKEVAHV